MREALRAIVEYGFEDLGLDGIEAYAPPQDARLVELLSGLSFQTDGVVKDGSLFFRMRKEDWPREGET